MVAWLAAVIAVVCIVVVSCCTIGGIYAYKLSMKNRVSTLVSKPGDYGDTSVPRGAECAECEAEAVYHHETHLDKDVHVAVPAAAAGEVGWAAVSWPFASHEHDASLPMLRMYVPSLCILLHKPDGSPSRAV